MMHSNDAWKQVVSFYQEKLNIPERIVEILSVYDILHSCCVGFSNSSISLELDIEEEVIKSVLIEYLNFKGWQEDLDISPLMVYNRVNGNLEFYWAAVMAIEDIIPKSFVNKSYDICNKFKDLEKELDKYYG